MLYYFEIFHLTQEDFITVSVPNSNLFWPWLASAQVTADDAQETVAKHCQNGHAMHLPSQWPLVLYICFLFCDEYKKEIMLYFWYQVFDNLIIFPGEKWSFFRKNFLLFSRGKITQILLYCFSDLLYFFPFKIFRLLSAFLGRHFTEFGA